jgi:Protein of unknown function (DUF4058)
MSKYSVLVARLNRELVKIQIVVQTAVTQVNKADNTGDLDPYLEAPDLWSEFHSRMIVALALAGVKRIADRWMNYSVVSIEWPLKSACI